MLPRVHRRKVAPVVERDQKAKKGSPMGSPLHISSLTMSYFHTGIRTIIGAEAFHCPVRDGKEWDHLAMVIRHNLLSAWGLLEASKGPRRTNS